MSAPYCRHCGGSTENDDHVECEMHLFLEPPGFCPQCRRQLRVQVTPLGWTATCEEHGLLTPS